MNIFPYFLLTGSRDKMASIACRYGNLGMGRSRLSLGRNEPGQRRGAPETSTKPGAATWLR